MKNEYKYYEFDPGQALIHLLNESIGRSELNAISIFQSPHRRTPDIYSCIKGRFKKVTYQKLFNTPERQIQDQNPVAIQKLSKSPKTIQNILSPQKTLYDYTSQKEDILVLYFPNLKDRKNDCVYILVDNNLQESIKTTLDILGIAKDKTVKYSDLVLAHFKMNYLMLKEFVSIEHRKYQFVEEMTNTIEKTIKSKNELVLKIEELKNSHKSGLENKVLFLLREKSADNGASIELSQNAQNYISNYNGDENKLLKAVSEAADLVIKMYALNRFPNLEIDLNFIEINMEDKGPFASKLNNKQKEKARLYLDKYEDAATLSLKFKNKVNIRYLSDYTLPKPVQPPAVSANIGKYKEEIRYLLLSYPQKWMVLRSHFSPISALSDINN